MEVGSLDVYMYPGYIKKPYRIEIPLGD